jgi:hypothetical protein
VAARLEDYLDGVGDAGIPTGARRFVGTRGRSRPLGFTPLLTPLQIRVPAITDAFRARFAATILPIYSSADKAALDAQMWALDSRWLGSASFKSMRACVYTKYTYDATRYVKPYVDGDCRNALGAQVSSTCDWGFWAIDKCDLDTASTQVFQFSRYLWAQARMRELLASRPQPGVTSPKDASDWTWKAAQLISALWWSTNVRFDNPNAQAVDYKADLLRAGLLMPAPTDATLGVPYDGPALTKAPYYVSYPLSPRALNALGYQRIVPTRQNDFSPGAGPLPWASASAPGPAHPMFAVATPSGPGNAYTSNLPLGMTEEQGRDLRALAFQIYSDSGDSDALRWASTKAFNEWWFRATWSWDTKWRVLGDFYTRTSRMTSDPGNPSGGGRVYGWSAQPSTVVLGGAALIVDDLARQLEHYSDAARNYIMWMQQAAQTYSVDTAGVGPSSPAAIDFLRARSDLNAGIATAAQQYGALSATPGGGSTDPRAVITGIAVGLAQTIISLVGSSVPIIGMLYTVMTQLIQQTLLPGGSAVGNTPCPAFPFIRVMAPSSGGCDLSQDEITSSILGIKSSARWPVAVGGQTRSFVVDGVPFLVTFTATDTTADAVARRINASAALVLPVAHALVASVRSDGQVHVEGADPGQGPARATGGTACVLGFPGPCTAPASMTPPATPLPLVAHSDTPSAPSSGGGGIAIGAGVLLALRLLLG